MRSKLIYGERQFEITRIDDSPFIVRIKEGEQETHLELDLGDKKASGRIKLQDCYVPYFVSSDAESIWVTLDGQTYTFKRSHGLSEQQPGLQASFTAPMPGKIVGVLVNSGDEVQKGQVLILLEAMKMEHRIEAPEKGTIVSVNAVEGDLVTQGFQLIEFKTLEQEEE